MDSLRAVSDLQDATAKMEAQYDKLVALKTKGDLQGYTKNLGDYQMASQIMFNLRPSNIFSWYLRIGAEVDTLINECTME